MKKNYNGHYRLVAWQWIAPLFFLVTVVRSASVGYVAFFYDYFADSELTEVVVYGVFLAITVVVGYFGYVFITLLTMGTLRHKNGKYRKLIDAPDFEAKYASLSLKEKYNVYQLLHQLQVDRHAKAAQRENGDWLESEIKRYYEMIIKLDVKNSNPEKD